MNQPDTTRISGPTRIMGLLWLMLISSGCQSYGPRIVQPAPFQYNEAVSQAWNEQLLLNVVRMHYRDTPLFLNVDQILAGYTFERSADVSVGILSGSGQAIDTAEGGLSVGLTERPTVTLTPLIGQEFTKRLLTPVAPETLLLLIASGWQVERVLLCCANSLNGLRNLPATPDANLIAPTGFPSFQGAAKALEKVQRSQGAGITVTVDESGRILLQLDGDGTDEFRRLTGLPSNDLPIPIAEQQHAPAEGELALTGRSFLGILTFLARYVESPPKHIEYGLAEPLTETMRNRVGPLFRIRSSTSKPKDNFVAVKYRDYWFSIPDNDLDAKETFGLLTQLFSLQSSAERSRSPLLTIPNN